MKGNTMLIQRRRAVAVTFVIALVAIPGHAAAASPEPSKDTLGASVQSRIYVSEGRELTFRNLSTTPAVFAFTSGGGWTTNTDSVTLGPGDQGTVAVVGDGEDDAAIGVSVTTAADIPPGTTRTALAFQAKIAHERPFDPSTLIRGGLIALLGLVALAFVIRRKPWRYVHVSFGGDNEVA